ncbi:MAG: hypothetical protein NWE90_05400 [Candidatus Bathyarchaeota archaeon]|nr:hypothetical protein [Candidatus Bathyarchaeota archaeon]
MARIRYKEAVGLEVRKGKPAVGKKPNKTELRKLYIKESKSIREIADILGCSKDMVYRALKEYGIRKDFITRKRKLSEATLGFLKKEFKTKSKKKVAVELGVSKSGLYKHLKKLGHY